MQLAPNRATFEMMSKLFCEKWSSVEPDFVAYFQKEWLGPHCNWFEGAAYYTATTNNGQESHNAVIKKKDYAPTTFTTESILALHENNDC